MTNRQGTLDALCRIPTAAPTPEPMQADLRETIRSGAGCSCRGVEMGSYDAQIELIPPAHMARTDGRGICIDACLALEVSGLWKKGITTTGCCCGHGKASAYIGVVPQDIELMKALGYSVLDNPSRPGDEDTFSPLSLAAMQAKSEPSFLGHLVAPASGVGAAFVPKGEAIPLMGNKGSVTPVFSGPQNVTAHPSPSAPNPDLAGLVEKLVREAVISASVEVPPLYADRVIMRDEITRNTTDALLALLAPALASLK